ncbi:MAG: hypothetical protein WC748_06965 [Legionellales bacterium]|jgi:hypothetical protein
MYADIKKLIDSVKAVLEKELQSKSKPYEADINTLLQKFKDLNLDLNNGIFDKEQFLYAIACGTRLQQTQHIYFFVLLTIELSKDLIWKNKKESAQTILRAVEEFILTKINDPLYAPHYTNVVTELLNIAGTIAQQQAVSYEDLRDKMNDQWFRNLTWKVETALTGCEKDDHLNRFRCIRSLASVYRELNEDKLHQLMASFNALIKVESDDSEKTRRELVLAIGQFCAIVANQVRKNQAVSKKEKKYIEEMFESADHFCQKDDPLWAAILLNLITVRIYENNFSDADHYIQEAYEVVILTPGMEYNETTLGLKTCEAERYYRHSLIASDLSEQLWTISKALELYRKIYGLHQQAPFLSNPDNVNAKIVELEARLSAIKEQDKEEVELELVALSEFSSEMRHSQVAPEDRILTAEEFAKLPDAGIINPFKLRVAQRGISPTFSDKTKLSDLRDKLVADPAYTNNVPEIEIGIYKGKVYSFDTRRLIVHMQARESNEQVFVRYKKINGAHLEKRIKNIFSPRPWNGLVTALREGGKNSISTAYIAPPLRPQLEDNVNKNFKKLPDERLKGSDDDNGFPMAQKKAEKIEKYLVPKAKEKHSIYAEQIIQETKNAGTQQGVYAAYVVLNEKQKEAKAKYSQQPGGPAATLNP